MPSNPDRRETSPPGPLPIDGEGEEHVPIREWVGVRFPPGSMLTRIVEVHGRRQAITSTTARSRRRAPHVDDQDPPLRRMARVSLGDGSRSPGHGRYRKGAVWVLRGFPGGRGLG
jgi:hypothetical protein